MPVPGQPAGSGSSSDGGSSEAGPKSYVSAQAAAALALAEGIVEATNENGDLTTDPDTLKVLRAKAAALEKLRTATAWRFAASEAAKRAEEKLQVG